jgi:hypothetical protein
MDNKINCFIAYNKGADFLQTIKQLKASELVNQIFLLSPVLVEIENTLTIVVSELFSTETIKLIAGNSNTAYSLIALQNQGLGVGQFAVDRMVQVAKNTGAAMVYTDYFEVKNGVQTPSPVIDYQFGSLRDDFNFGPVQLFRNDVLKTFDEHEFNWAGYYSMRLHASRLGELVRIP